MVSGDLIHCLFVLLVILWLLHPMPFPFPAFFPGNSADVASPQLGRNPAPRLRQILGSPNEKIEATLSHWAPKGNAETVWHSRECTMFSRALIAKAWGSESARCYVLFPGEKVPFLSLLFHVSKPLRGHKPCWGLKPACQSGVSYSGCSGAAATARAHTTLGWSWCFPSPPVTGAPQTQAEKRGTQELALSWSRWSAFLLAFRSRLMCRGMLRLSHLPSAAGSRTQRSLQGFFAIWTGCSDVTVWYSDARLQGLENSHLIPLIVLISWCPKPASGVTSHSHWLSKCVGLAPRWTNVLLFLLFLFRLTIPVFFHVSWCRVPAQPTKNKFTGSFCLCKTMLQNQKPQKEERKL